jgi:hypothetical protein
MLLKKDPDKKFINDMNNVLSKLDDKAEILKIRLQKENDERKRKDILLLLKVNYKQHKKGEKLIQEKYMSSHST